MKRIVLITLLALFSGCSTKVISFYVEDEPKIEFDTFSFYKREVSELNEEQSKLDSLLQLTIENTLIEKGYTKSYPSDVYIGFSITTGTSSTTQSPYDIRYPNYSPYNRYGNYYYTTTTQYKEGVFLIELYNRDDKLIWQGSKTFKVRSSVPIKDMLLQNATEIMSVFKNHS